VRLLRPGGYVLAFAGVWPGLPSSSEDREGYFERCYSVEVRAAIPATHINTMDPLIEMFRSAGFARASVRPTLSKFAIIAQTG
jgi:hypothetical protein